MLILFLAKSQMKRINVTVCARTNEYGSNHAPLAYIYNCTQWQNSSLLLKATDYASRHSPSCLISQKVVMDLVNNHTSLDKF